MTLINYSSGFSPSKLSLNGVAALSGNVLQLTDGGTGEAGSSWYSTPVSVSRFATDFSFQLSDAVADGFTFTIQNAGLNARGTLGGGLGYEGIDKSVAVKFDLHDNAGEGNNSIGVYSNGMSPSIPSVDLTGTEIDLHAGHIMQAHLVYESGALTVSLTDAVTGATTSDIFSVDIPTIVGSPYAYVGFTAGTGSLTATQDVLSWTYGYANEASAHFCHVSPSV